MSDTPLQRTPLYPVHLASKARMVDFGGWEMPVQYSGLVDEHNTVRKAVGLFDVSHMGEIEVRGPQAVALVESVTSNNVEKLKIGQVHYSGLMLENGAFVDDILVHKVAQDHLFLCVNASNQDKDFAYIQQHNHFDAEVEFASTKYAQIAVQGPKAARTLQKLTHTDLSALKYYWFADGDVTEIPARIAHTGYTGEDGFEVYVPPDAAASVWKALLDAGEEFGIKPCGLGARNTLRLEAKMALYGHEINDELTPVEADLGWIVKMDKGEFIGRSALQHQQQTGVARKLVGFEMVGRGIGRDGYEVRVEGKSAGWVTSGSPSPTLGRNIGLCYVPYAVAEPGHRIEVVVRNEPVEALTVATPFYKRAK